MRSGGYVTVVATKMRRWYAPINAFRCTTDVDTILRFSGIPPVIRIGMDLASLRTGWEVLIGNAFYYLKCCTQLRHDPGPVEAAGHIEWEDNDLGKKHMNGPSL